MALRFVALLNLLMSQGFQLGRRKSNAVDSHDYGESAIEPIQSNNPGYGIEVIVSAQEHTNPLLPNMNESGDDPITASDRSA